MRRYRPIKRPVNTPHTAIQAPGNRLAYYLIGVGLLAVLTAFISMEG